MNRSPMASIGLALTFAMVAGMVTVAAVGGQLVATYLVAGLLMSIVGWRILISHPRHGVGRLLMVAGVSGTALSFCMPYAQLSLSSGRLPGEWVAAWAGSWIWAVQLACLPALLFVYPSGRALGRWRWVFRVWVAAVAAVILTGAVQLVGTSAGEMVAQARPGAPELPEYRFLNDAAPLLIMFLGFPLGGVSFSRRWVGGGLETRHQMKWLALGPVAMAMALVTMEVLDAPPVVSGVAWATALTVFPLAIGMAILRYRLYDIDRIISRTVSYALVVGLLALAVAAVAAVAGSQFETPWVVAATTLAVAAMFNPLRRRVQGWVDRRFNRSRYDAQRVMDDFAGSLRDPVDADGVIDGWVWVVRGTMEPGAIGVWVRDHPE